MASPKELSGPAGNTVIGPSILINGKLTGDEDLTVRGRVEGEIALTRPLIVEPSGVVKANVSVKNAVVSGVVVGNIAATESVELTRDGRMVGDIRSPRVIIVDGASFRGRVDMGELAPGRPLPERPRTQVRPGVRTALAQAPTRPPALPPRPPARAPMPAFASKPAPGGKAPPAPPPVPPTVAAGAKKKIILKKKR
jgi:cytoskeletal protein CcmA (bactofilin family)